MDEKFTYRVAYPHKMQLAGEARYLSVRGEEIVVVASPEEATVFETAAEAASLLQRKPYLDESHEEGIVNLGVPESILRQSHPELFEE